MKNYLKVGFILYAIGMLDLFYWIYYWNSNEQIVVSNFKQFKLNYFESLPSIIRPLYQTRPQLSAILYGIFFVISGFIFLKTKNKFLKVLSITAFIFAFFELFSIM
jgi:hypothetical protein